MNERVIALVEAETGKSGLSLDSMFSTLKLDSLEFVNLMLSVENEFSIKISDEEMQSITTVGDLVKLIKAKSA